MIMATLYRPALTAIARVLLWGQRMAAREALERMPEHLRGDVGYQPDQARTEIERRFWQPLEREPAETLAEIERGLEEQAARPEMPGVLLPEHHALMPARSDGDRTR